MFNRTGIKMNKRASLVIASTILISPFTNFASASWYPYMGISAGQSSYGDVCNTSAGPTITSCEDTDTALKVYAGAKVGRYTAFEVSYMDIGQAELRSDSTYTVEASGFNISGFGILPVTNNIDLFARAGALAWKAERNSTAGPVADSDGIDLSYGAGVNIGISRHFAIRAEYENFQRVGGEVTSGETPVTLISLGVSWYF
jgi:OmpA-OmpF porin, OOP family